MMSEIDALAIELKYIHSQPLSPTPPKGNPRSILHQRTPAPQLAGHTEGSESEIIPRYGTAGGLLYHYIA
jgi:hypothetical protein